MATTRLHLTRLINAVLLLTGLVWFKPLAYFVAVMMLIAGLTGYCPTEHLLRTIGVRDTCNSQKPSKKRNHG